MQQTISSVSALGGCHWRI